mgnify:CR=1 FL=1
MKFLKIIHISAAWVSCLLVSAGCSHEVEPDGNVSGGASLLSEDNPGSGGGMQDHACFVPGEAVVLLSEELCSRVEAAVATKGGAYMAEGLEDICRELGVSRLERLFPHAGEYEERTRREGLHRYYLVDFDSSVSLSAAEQGFAGIEGVEKFERQHRVAEHATVNDPYWSRQWDFGPDNGINVEKVWDYTRGRPEVIVCIVDQGVQIDHPDLSWNC